MSQKLEDKFDGWSNDDPMENEMKMSPENSAPNASFGIVKQVNENAECPAEAEYCPIFHVHSKVQDFSKLAFYPEEENSTHSWKESSRDSQDFAHITINDDTIHNQQNVYPIIREKYNPRLMSSPPSTIPLTEMKNDVIQKRSTQEPHPAHPMKNYVVDYRNLRKSGFFLTCHKKKQNDNPILMDPNLRLAVPRADQVKKWLNNLPDTLACLEEADDDFMGEGELAKQMETPHSPFPFCEEENLKHFVLNNEHINYTLKPESTLSYKAMDWILETANSKIDDYLDKLHKTPGYVEHEYVKGQIEIPAFFKNVNDQQNVPFQGSSGDSWFDMFKKWMSTFSKNEEERHINNESLNRISEHQIVLEPYHGPVSVNGAMIESGGTQLILGNGILGTVVEEIKAALQAINQALRRVPLHVSAASRSTVQVHPSGIEDPEVMKLTEMLQTKPTFQKKPTLRTVFGLKNTDKIPSYGLRFQRRRLQQHTRRRSFLRAVNGWIHTKNHGQMSRQRYRILTSSGTTNNRAPIVEEQQTGRPREQEDPRIGSLITGVMSAIRSMVPFYPIPVAPAREQLNGQSRPARINSTHDAPLVIPTRYQIFRNSSRSNVKGNKVKKIHVVKN